MLALSFTDWFVAGIAVGVAYFVGIWWSSRQFAGGGRVSTIIALSLLRLVVLGGLLTVASFRGAGPLLAMALGVVLARFGVMLRTREIAP